MGTRWGPDRQCRSAVEDGGAHSGNGCHSALEQKESAMQRRAPGLDFISWTLSQYGILEEIRSLLHTVRWMVLVCFHTNMCPANNYVALTCSTMAYPHIVAC